MARVCIAYAHPEGAPSEEHALAVLAQDGESAILAAVPRDVIALAADLGLPTQTFVGWTEMQQAKIEPIVQPLAGRYESEEIPVSDPRWLAAFTKPTPMMTVSWGEIHEVPGPAAEVAEARAAELAPGS